MDCGGISMKTLVNHFNVTRTPIEHYKHGRYSIVGNVGDYQVREDFGSYRLMKKKFKTVNSAKLRIDSLERKQGYYAWKNATVNETENDLPRISDL